jgi:ABC-type glycerol-3-phosphate transport system permease component
MSAIAATGRVRLPQRRRRFTINTRTIVLAVFCAIWIYPFVWLLSASLKAPLGIFSKGLSLLPGTAQWSNYSEAWSQAGFSHYMVNSVVVTAGTVVLVTVRSALAGYVLGRFSFPGKKLIIIVLIATFFLPEGYTIVPITQLSHQLHLLNSRLGIILGLGAGGQVPATLLFAAYFRTLPKELDEAATVDGAGPLRIFFRVMLPLAKPVTWTVILLQFLHAWNAFLLPLVFTLGQESLRTLAVGMVAFQGNDFTNYSALAAAAVISLAPVIVLFVVLQKHFVDAVAGAVKQ